MKLLFLFFLPEKMVWFSVILVFCVAFTTAAKDFRWCTVKKDEVSKCNKFKEALPGIAKMVGVSITAACVSGSSDEDCMKKIQDNKADFVTLDGGKIYEAGKTYKLVPIVAESYGPPDGISYYAVAVAKKNTNVTFKNLKGRRSCHTGYRKTAGWIIPVGTLLEGAMAKKGCDAQSASEFFSESCVPDVPQGYSNLCKLCQESKCTSQNNKYSGYHGAFYCMADDKGDVAFVKHLTTGEVVGKESKYGSMSDYKYLCVDGTTKEVTANSHENCSLASNPSHAVVARAGNNTDFIRILLKASNSCQPATTASQCSDFLIFNSANYAAGKKDLLFKDSTKKLVDVMDRNTYRTWLGDGYTKAIEALGDEKCPTSPSPTGTIMLNPFPALLVGMAMVIKAIL